MNKAQANERELERTKERTKESEREKANMGENRMHVQVKKVNREH